MWASAFLKICAASRTVVASPLARSWPTRFPGTSLSQLGLHDRNLNGINTMLSFGTDSSLRKMSERSNLVQAHPPDVRTDLLISWWSSLKSRDHFDFLAGCPSVWINLFPTCLSWISKIFPWMRFYSRQEFFPKTAPRPSLLCENG